MTKALGWVGLLVAGALSLPLAATFLDGQGTENLVLPAQLVGMAVVGGLAGVLLPGFVHGEPRRQFAVGAAYGLVAAVLGYLLFFLLISGFSGA